MRGCFDWNYGPFEQSLLTFSGCLRPCWLQSTMVLMLGPWICTDGHLADSWMRCMMEAWWDAAHKHRKKNNMKFGGDLGSNPGPKDCKPHLQPLHHLGAFVSKIEKKHYIKQTHYMLKIRKSARPIWTCQSHAATAFVFNLSCKHKTHSGGF